MWAKHSSGCLYRGAVLWTGIQRWHMSPETNSVSISPPSAVVTVSPCSGMYREWMFHTYLFTKSLEESHLLSSVFICQFLLCSWPLCFSVSTSYPQYCPQAATWEELQGFCFACCLSPLIVVPWPMSYARCILLNLMHSVHAQVHS